MSYNVENLFDSKDDTDREDETYLPLKDKHNRNHKQKCKRIPNFKFRKDCYSLNWSDQVIQAKIKNLSEVILSVDGGRGPDILILVEVENTNILKQLNESGLRKARYKTVELIEGDDPRGIDVAVLSRFPKAETAQLLSLHITDSKSGNDLRTRGVLRVPLKISKNLILTVFAVHLPSQGSPTKVREQAISKLNLILKSESNSWIAGGDFNITQKEENSDQLISEKLSKLGKVSHLIGCQNCQGTHFYKKKWAFLDLLYFDSRLQKRGGIVLTDSIRVVNDNSVSMMQGKPLRFDPVKGQGASDHFPIYARLRF